MILERHWYQHTLPNWDALVGFAQAEHIYNRTQQEIQRVDGSNRYEHIQRVRGVLQRYLPHIPVGMEIATVLHDEHIQREDILSLFALNPEGERYDMVAALGYCASMEQFEKAAEEWRGMIVDHLMHNQQGSLLEGTLQDMCALDGVDIHTMCKRVREAIQDHDGAVLEVGSGLRAFRPPQIDVESMLKVLQDWDVEGLLIKAAEVIDNLEHPNPQRPASAWRDAQELLYLYGPLLDVAGFKQLAAEGYSTALEYLNRNIFFSEEKEQLACMYASASCYFDKQGDSIAQALQNISPAGSQISRRLKCWGSLLEKVKKKDRKYGTSPDVIGWRIVVPDSTSPNDILAMVEQIYTILSSFELSPGHTRPDEPTAELWIAGMPEKELTLRGDPQKKIYTRGPRRSGYQAGHLNAWSMQNRYTFGVEVQVVHASADECNDIGQASHIFYKAQQGGFGSFSQLARLLEREPSSIPLQNMYQIQLQQMVEQLGIIRRRGESFFRPGPGYVLRGASLISVLSSYGISPTDAEIAALLQEV